ncbi:MAG TPA: hypothetical protein VNG69_05765 [Casimicrobiaceae bacterium]|nr:hypothetical protein [Casimicrobiaceae bacterium]
MKVETLVLTIAVITLVPGCAATPTATASLAAELAAAPTQPVPVAPAPVRMIESPPIEPVAPLAQAPRTPDAPSEPAGSNLPQAVTLPPASPTPPPIVISAEPSPEEKEFTALLADLQRYGAMNGDDLRREQQTMTQTLNRTRSDAIRVRVAVLHTLLRQSTQDDQRALALFEAVAKSNPGSPAVKQLAAVLSVQVLERVRAVRDEQARSEAALQKLEALRAMERSLLRDRVRSGGGGGGAGSGGGN